LEATREELKRSAEAAHVQADTTRAMFDAIYRPYLRIVGDDGNYFTAAGAYRLIFSLSTHGQVPAVILGTRVSVRASGGTLVFSHDGSDEEVVFPGERKQLSFHKDIGGGELLGAVEASVEVRYRGSRDIEYVTAVRQTGKLAENLRTVGVRIT
jgi:hypothetical protein